MDPVKREQLDTGFNLRSRTACYWERGRPRPPERMLLKREEKLL